MAIVLDPPDAVVRNGVLALFLEIEAGENYRSYGQQEQQNRDKASLAFPIHGLRYLPRTPVGLERRGSGIPPIGFSPVGFLPISD